ncbi:MAG TPA: DUF3842 family protein [Syntrophobacteraceae bacterium]|nr:DUF3842 family protein [Syntrophobacteraceae bacterium]
MVRIAVIDGQGGSVGSTIIKRIRKSHGESLQIWALGTNAAATSLMMKAHANRGASGENAVCHCVNQVDVVIGSLSILICNAMMGEITAAMVEAIGNSKATKLLLPITEEPVTVVGVISEPLPHLVERLVNDYLDPMLSERIIPQQGRRSRVQHLVSVELKDGVASEESGREPEKGTESHTSVRSR